MAPNPRPIALLCGLAVLLVLVAPGCGWWAWEGDSENLNSNENTDQAADGGDVGTSGDGSADSSDTGTDESTTPEDPADNANQSTDAATCGQDADCNDGLFCTGVETCVDGACLAGVEPCATGQTCDETTGQCTGAPCETDTDCDQAQVCQDGSCLTNDAASNGLQGLAVDALTGEEIDFGRPLQVGDTLLLEAPDPTAAVRLPGADCTCVWTVVPATAGLFTAASDCATDFTVIEAGPFAIAVEVTCPGRSTTFRQAATAEADEGLQPCATDDDCPAGETCQDQQCTVIAGSPCTTDADCPTGQVCQGEICVRTTPASCTADQDCAEGEVCQDGFCATAPPEPPSMTLFEMQTRQPYVVRFDLWLKDGDGRAIPEAVTADHFRIYEDDARIDVTETNKFVTPASDLPLRVMLVLDYSASMDSVDAVEPMIAAAEQFVRADHFTGTHSIGIIESHDRMEEEQGYSVAVPLTAADLSGKDAIVRGIPAADSVESGLSRVWDAAALAIETLAQEERQLGETRVVIFLTDGRDTTSEQTPEDLLALAQASEVNLYPIGFGNVGDHETMLRSLADDTGGGYFPAADGDALEDTFAEVARELQGQWTLTYITPTNSGDVGVRVEFDWQGGTAAVQDSFDASSLAGDVHHGVIEVLDRTYDAVSNRTDFLLRAAYVPRNVSRFRLTFAHSTAIFNLQDAGGLTAPQDGWSATPLGDGVFDLLGPRALEYGAFGNIGTASVPGDVPVLQVTHDDTIYGDLAQPKSVTFEADLWAAPYELTVVVEPTGTGTVVVDPEKASYAYGEVVTLTAVDGSKPFDHWSGDAEGTTTPKQVTMDGNKSITAVFADPP